MSKGTIKKIHEKLSSILIPIDCIHDQSHAAAAAKERRTKLLDAWIDEREQEVGRLVRERLELNAQFIRSRDELTAAYDEALDEAARAVDPARAALDEQIDHHNSKIVELMEKLALEQA